MNTKLDPLLTKKEVADLVSQDLKLSYRHVYDKFMFLPEFPRPLAINSATGMRPAMRWMESEVVRFLAGMRRAV
jgi:predicted DNA-binding transcriptional regulator AlpA